MYMYIFCSYVYACTAVSTLSSTKGPSDPREHYLGLLYPSEQYKVYPIILSLPLSHIIYCHVDSYRSSHMQ